MPYDPNRHHCRSIRLKGYDYSQAGAYFITLCTQDRACLFGRVVNGEMRLNDADRMVLAECSRLPERFPPLVVDAFVAHERALSAIRPYIMENPRRWHRDREKEARSASDPVAQAIRNMPKQEETDHSLGGEP
jgi:putative transposase